MSTTNIDVFADLIDKLNVRSETTARTIQERVESLSVHDAVAVASALHNKGWQASEIYTAIISGHDTEMEPIDITQLITPEQHEEAKTLIEAWRTKLFYDKMFGTYKMSEWREGLAHLLANPEKTLSKNDLKLVTSLPRYHEYEERYTRLASEYKISSKRVKYASKVATKLTFIEAWEERAAKEGRRKVYAFKTDTNKLVIVPFQVNAFLQVQLLDQLLKFTNKIKVEGKAYSRRVGPDKFVLQYDRLFDIEAINENV